MPKRAAARSTGKPRPALRKRLRNKVKNAADGALDRVDEAGGDAALAAKARAPAKPRQKRAEDLDDDDEDGNEEDKDEDGNRGAGAGAGAGKASARARAHSSSGAAEDEDEDEDEDEGEDDEDGDGNMVGEPDEDKPAGAGPKAGSSTRAARVSARAQSKAELELTHGADKVTAAGAGTFNVVELASICSLRYHLASCSLQDPGGRVVARQRDAQHDYHAPAGLPLRRRGGPHPGRHRGLHEHAAEVRGGQAGRPGGAAGPHLLRRRASPTDAGGE